MRKLRRTFATGLLILVPLLATIDILRWAVDFIDQSVAQYLPDSFTMGEFPGRGVLLLCLVVILLGSITQNFIGKWFVSQFDDLLGKLPLVGALYSGIKKFLETVLSPSNDKFNEAVLVEFPMKGIFSIGFRTGEPDPKVIEGMNDVHLVNVFIPLVPNPTAGFYILVPENNVKRLDLTVQEAFKIAISMGVMTTTEPKALE